MIAGLSGIGYFHATANCTDSHLAILVISASLVESLAEADWSENDRNAIVASIARMTITTMSSTRVNQERLIKLLLNLVGFEFVIILLIKYKG